MRLSVERFRHPRNVHEIPRPEEFVGVSSSGVIMATYRTGADIKGGSSVPETPSEAELARRAEQER